MTKNPISECLSGIGIPVVYVIAAFAGLTSHAFSQSMPFSRYSPQMPMDAGHGYSGGGGDSIDVRSRANKPIRFSIINQDGSPCSRNIIKPGLALDLPMCGKKLRWHDGSKYEEISASAGHIYEISWAATHWDISDVTDKIQ